MIMRDTRTHLVIKNEKSSTTRKTRSYRVGGDLTQDVWCVTAARVVTTTMHVSAGGSVLRVVLWSFSN